MANNQDSKHPCYHCGLPVPEGIDLHLDILDKSRDFCCPGCHAVAQAIHEGGMDDFYLHRETPSGRLDVDQLPEFLDNLTLYDRAEIQREFVHQVDGYKEASLILENIRCPACLWLNEQQLRKLDGVLSVEIDYTSERATVQWDSEKINFSQILKAIADIGYTAHPYDPAHHERLQNEQKQRSTERLIYSGLVMMMVMNFSIASYIMGYSDGQGRLPLWMIIGRWTSLLITTSILVYPAQDFFIGAWNDIKNRRVGMDIPIVLGLLTAYVGSFVSTVQHHGEVYFDSIAMFVTFLLFARRAELNGRRRAAAHLDTLAKVIPQTARVVQPDGTDNQVSILDIKAGDEVRVLPGETVPLDGLLKQGAGQFDESLLTGEAHPVLHGPGDTLIAGSLSYDQTIVFEVTGDSSVATPTRLRKLLHQGARSRPRIAQITERVASVFVVLVLILAGTTALYWGLTDPSQALSNTVAVLIVTCPCALALATPVALTVGAGQLTRNGIVPFNMNAIEQLAHADTVVFDKTGTLTLGRPVLVDQFIPSSEALALVAAALAESSNHPLSVALFKNEPDHGLKVSAPNNQPGQGLSGEIDGTVWKLGEAHYVSETISRPFADYLEQQTEKGLLTTCLGHDGELLAVFSFQDKARPNLQATIDHLKATGIKQISIYSGDQPLSVHHLAESIGITDWHAAMTPEDKLISLGAFQGAGHKVMMVGDGINDAPTLAAANVSLSFDSATDLAQSHSDFSFLGEDMDALIHARELARDIQRTIIQNLSWAAVYNLLAIPAAMLGYIPPWAAAIGMSVSSLIVVGNSLRIQKKSRSENPHAA